MLFETETVEQRFLHHRPLAHHRPLSRSTDKVNQRAVTAASRSFQQNPHKPVAVPGKRESC